MSDLSFEVRDGEVLALIGPNGAGKSTTFNLISGLLAPDRGRITFDGRDVTRLPPPVRAHLGIGRTFQVMQPFHYDDWATAERERLQTLALGAMGALAGLLLDEQPRESLRLAGRMLAIDPAWEEAYRIEMRAHLAIGNRVQALRAYERCVAALRELGLEPLPETQALVRTLRGRPSPPVTRP